VTSDEMMSRARGDTLKELVFITDVPTIQARLHFAAVANAFTVGHFL
jgi:hypothetical protein